MADKKNVPCFFFRKGACRNGDNCPFSHDPNCPPAAQEPQQKAVPQQRAGAPSRFIYIEPKHPSVYYSIDVECVATDVQHNARATAQISLVSYDEQCILNLYVKPESEVRSYLSPLTGLSKELLDQHGIGLDQAMAILRSHLPKHAILVGQNIRKDVEWLQLEEGKDFESVVDLAVIGRVWNEKFSSFTYFGLDHTSTCWLGQANSGAPHNAVTDAIKSMQIFKLYLSIQNDQKRVEELQKMLLATPLVPSFAKQNPTYEGCCMGNRKTCTCGAPFFS